jgi:hypothetical protein
MNFIKIAASAFLDELEKISVNLQGLRSATKHLNVPILKGRTIDVEALGTAFLSGGRTKIEKKGVGLYALNPSVMNSSITKKLDPNNHMKNLMTPYKKPVIFSGKGGGLRLIDSIKKQYGEDVNFTHMIKDKKSKEAINRLMLLHEGSEARIRPITQSNTGSHLSPNVLVEESNIVSSFPKELAPAKRYMRMLRRNTGESAILENLHPSELRYGQRRYSSGEKNLMLRKSQLAYGIKTPKQNIDFEDK